MYPEDPRGWKDPSLVDPDNWTIDSALIDRPGAGEILAAGLRS
jgi:hypothetical protein